jgi:4-amino-4-deoxychorismate lyase
MLTADEVFFCNSLYGIWPVKRLAEKTFAQNPVTQQLQSLLHYV